MKIDLTFSGATPGDLRRLADALEGVTVSTPPIAPPAAQAGTVPAVPTASMPAPATASPAIPAMPANPGAGDDDEDDNSGGPVAPGEPDAAGIRYDARIHSDPPSQTGKGLWRKKRNVAKELVAQVEAEQKAAAAPAMPSGGVTMPTATVPMPTAAAMPMPTAAAAPAAAMPMPSAAMPMPSAAPVAQQPAPQPAAAPAGQIDFAALMGHLTGKMQQIGPDGHALVTMEYLTRMTGEIAQAFGKQLTAITDIASEPNMIAYAVQILQRDGRW